MSSVFEKILKYFLFRDKVGKNQNRRKKGDKSNSVSPERQRFGGMVVVFPYFLGLFLAGFWLFWGRGG